MKQGFLLRIQDVKLKQLKRFSQKLGMSLNQYINLAIDNQSRAHTTGISEDSHQRDAIVELILKSSLSKAIEGIILFGSVAKETASESSDYDLCIVLNKDSKIHRGLYRIWDDEIEGNLTKSITLGREVSPHFVCYPQSLDDVHSLWLEVAISGRVIWSHSDAIDAALRRIRESIAEGRFVRSSSHGQPYWIRNEQLMKSTGR